jgi:HAD superfamily hydrolase (TIGR01509 family)
MAWTYRSVAFDLDGTLVDTEPHFERTVTELLRDRGHALTVEVADGMLGTTTRQAFEMIRGRYGLAESVEVLARESIDRMAVLLGREPAALFPGARELLGRLTGRGVPLAICTSSHRAYVEQVLGPFGVLDRFAFVLTAEDVARGKPLPEIYQKAAARFGHHPSEMLVIEDSPNGLKAARAAGARCVVVTTARLPRDGLVTADALVPALTSPELWSLLGLD